MIVLYSNPFYNKVCYKGSALYHTRTYNFIALLFHRAKKVKVLASFMDSGNSVIRFHLLGPILFAIKQVYSIKLTNPFYTGDS